MYFLKDLLESGPHWWCAQTIAMGFFGGSLLEVVVVGQGQGREVLSEKDFAILGLEANKSRLLLVLAFDKLEVKVLAASLPYRHWVLVAGGKGVFGDQFVRLKSTNYKSPGH